MTKVTDAAQHKKTRRHADYDAATRMGFLVHELRNALACVFVAQAMIRKAPDESAAEALLERNLQHMRVLLDRADTEVRLHKEPEAHRRPMRLAEAVREVSETAAEQARLKGVTLAVSVDPRLTVSADGPYLASALANLVRNAIKFTSPGGTVWVRGLEKEHAALLEVEDQCGGLPAGRVSELFEPFTQKGADRSGLGLGLAISRRAVELNHGTLGARDLPGKGCVFTISLPKARARREGCHGPVTIA
jgi:signal transduction histidine kinase